MDFGDLRLPQNEYSAEDLEEAIKNNTLPAFATKIINDYQQFIKMVQRNNRYYIAVNDCSCNIGTDERIKKLEETIKNMQANPLRTADNQKAHGFYGLLVNQKVAYLFSEQIVFTSKNKEFNKYLEELSKILYGVISELAVYASNGGRAWLYPYLDENGNFKLASCEATNVIPFYDSTIEKRLKYCMRIYNNTFELLSADATYYYDKNKKGVYEQRKDEEGNAARRYHYYETREKRISKKKYNVGKTWGKFPIIEFDNNIVKFSDLNPVKLFIDAYDMIVNLYLNDIEDIQQLIFVLINYGGQDLKEFLDDLRKYKAIKVSKTGAGTDGGVDTLKIDIPVEARVKLLEIIEKNIWRLGQGVDPNPETIGNSTSGVALKHLYGLLDLKAGLMENQFRSGINKLLDIYKIYLKESKNVDFMNENVDTVITKTMITNDTETITNLANSQSILSKRTLVANHPYVDNVEDELKQIKNEYEEAIEQYGFGDEKDESSDEENEKLDE